MSVADNTPLLRESEYIATLVRPIRWSRMDDFLLKVLNFKPSTSGVHRSKTDNPIFNVRVLLVEDNPMNQKVARLHLEKLGCTVDIAKDGEEGVKMYFRTNYDIVFMDIQMPVMDGYEATRIIRQTCSSENRRAPIIALTANAMEGQREVCLQAGMDGYITKPLMKEDLLQVLYQWCKR